MIRLHPSRSRYFFLALPSITYSRWRHPMTFRISCRTLLGEVISRCSGLMVWRPSSLRRSSSRYRHRRPLRVFSFSHAIEGVMV